MIALERVFCTLDHNEPDKVPWFELSIDNLRICDYFSEGYYLQGKIKSFADTYKLCKEENFLAMHSPRQDYGVYPF